MCSLLDDEYKEPLQFDPTLHPDPAIDPKYWDPFQRVGVVSKVSKKRHAHSLKEQISVDSVRFGFDSVYTLNRVQEYLKINGGYHLVEVRDRSYAVSNRTGEPSYIDVNVRIQCI